MSSLGLSFVAIVISCVAIVMSCISLNKFKKGLNKEIIDVIASEDYAEFIKEKIHALLGSSKNLSELTETLTNFLQDQAGSNEASRYAQIMSWLYDRNTSKDNTETGYEIPIPGTKLNTIYTPSLSNTDTIPVNEAFPNGIPVLDSIEALEKANNEQVPNEYVVTKTDSEESARKCDKYKAKN